MPGKTVRRGIGLVGLALLTLGGMQSGIFGTPQAPAPMIGPFDNAHELPPHDWKEATFALNHAYPTTPPAGETLPWKGIDAAQQPEKYLRRVLTYAYEGNIDTDWHIENNLKRPWFHVPALNYGDAGREFIHGMTQERVTTLEELDPDHHKGDKQKVQNWGVAAYNAIGGYTLGQVWKDPANPDPTAALFREGTVAVKLIFTQATPKQIPYLAGAPKWRANIWADPTAPSPRDRCPTDLYLLQIDVAVKDSCSSPDVGWVLGTFVYNGAGRGKNAWNRVVPLGAMWGEELTPVKQTWVSTRHQPVVHPHLGTEGRLNGTVDNPSSSCLSCHATAQFRTDAQGKVMNVVNATMTPGSNLTPAEAQDFFRNVRSGTPFDRNPNHPSTDYSLELAVGITHFRMYRAALLNHQSTNAINSAPARQDIPPAAHTVP